MLIVLSLFNLIRWRPCFSCFILCQVDFITRPAPNYALIFIKKGKKKTEKKKETLGSSLSLNSPSVAGFLLCVCLCVCGVSSGFCLFLCWFLLLLSSNPDPGSVLHGTPVQREAEAEKI